MTEILKKNKRNQQPSCVDLFSYFIAGIMLFIFLFDFSFLYCFWILKLNLESDYYDV